MSHFGTTLRLLRTDAGVSLRALAHAIGVSGAYLSRVENGHDAVPTPDRLVAIARALQLPPQALLELANKLTPAVASYLDRVPAAGALFGEIARRNLSGLDLARVRAYLDAEFPLETPRAEHSVPKLSALLAPERVVLDMSCRELDDAIDVAALRLAAGLQGTSAAEVAHALSAREREASSALGEGVAVPHAVLEGQPARAALVTLGSPIRSPTPDQQPISVVIALLLDRSGPRELALLARVARLAAPGFAGMLAGRTDPESVIREIGDLGL